MRSWRVRGTSRITSQRLTLTVLLKRFMREPSRFYRKERLYLAKVRNPTTPNTQKVEELLSLWNESSVISRHAGNVSIITVHDA